MDSEATVVIQNISVSATPILSIHHHMGLYIISDSSINSKRVERSWFLVCYVHSARFELVRWLMPDAESSVIIGNVLISIITTLTELFLKSVTFIDQYWLEMP